MSIQQEIEDVQSFERRSTTEEIHFSRAFSSILLIMHSLMSILILVRKPQKPISCLATTRRMSNQLFATFNKKQAV